MVFLDAEYTDSEETINAVDEIITRKASSKRVVICTSVLDNGVSFFDTEFAIHGLVSCLSVLFLLVA